jgi:hypothetical protein
VYFNLISCIVFVCIHGISLFQVSLYAEVKHSDKESTASPTKVISETGISQEELKLLQEALQEDQEASRKNSSPKNSSPKNSSPKNANIKPNTTTYKPQRNQNTANRTRSYSFPSSRSGARPSFTNPEISVTLDIATSYFSHDDISIQQTGAHDPNRTGFTFQQLEFHIASFADQLIRVESNLVFSAFGVEVEEAYARSLNLPARLQLRLGQFYTPFGIVNAQHPHAWSFTDQVLVNGKFFGGEGSRGLGAELSWLVPVSWFMKWTLALQHADDQCCARSFIATQKNKIQRMQDFLYITHVKQFFNVTRTWGIYWGLSTQLGKQPLGVDNRTEIYGTDLHVRWKPVSGKRGRTLTLQTEILHRRRQLPRKLLTDSGGYSQLLWNYSLFWQFGVRHEYIQGTLEDPLDPTWQDDRQRSTVQITWFPSHFTRWRLQSNLTHQNQDHLNAWSLMLAFEATIGSHGSHAY